MPSQCLSPLTRRSRIHRIGPSLSPTVALIPLSARQVNQSKKSRVFTEVINMIKKISCLGLGTIGSGMASNHFKAGHQLNSARRVRSFQSPRVVALVANVSLLIATASAQERLLPELPQAKSPVKLVAASDPITGKSEFCFQGNNIPPVIRVPLEAFSRSNTRMSSRLDQEKNA